MDGFGEEDPSVDSVVQATGPIDLRGDSWMILCCVGEGPILNA
jgi:hypothetical protein